MSPFEWSRECTFIQNVTDQVLSGTRFSLRESFNDEPAAFVRYCGMQRDLATRQGRDDAATYIQHCLDDLASLNL